MRPLSRGSISARSPRWWRPCGPVVRGDCCQIARAYSLAQASAAAPFEYVALLFGVLWGFAIWQEIPPWATWAGAFLTIISGVYILNRERRERPIASVGSA